jgi:hypothetical protein
MSFKNYWQYNSLSKCLKKQFQFIVLTPALQKDFFALCVFLQKQKQKQKLTGPSKKDNNYNNCN